MPRGGPRPGAGAPIGNANALRTGASSRRMREAWRALQLLIENRDEPKLRAIVAAAATEGLLGSRATIRANMPRLIQLIHPMLVDCSTTSTINTNQNQSDRRRSTASRQAAPAASEPESAGAPVATAADQPDRQKTKNNQTRRPYR